MAKSRIKSDKQIEPIADWSKADDFVRMIGDFQLQIKQAEKKANDEINVIKAELVLNTDPLLKKITILTDSLEAFAANHTEDFGKAQSRKLNFGLLGWRKSSEISIKKTTLELIKKVFGKKADQYLHIKESVNKDALKALAEKQLNSIDAQQVNKEPFFVEPDLPEAVNYEK